MPNNTESHGTTSGNRENQANTSTQQQMDREKQKTQMSGGQSAQKPGSGHPDDKDWNDPARSGSSGGQQSNTGGSGTGQNFQRPGQSSGSGKSGSGGSGQGSGSDRNS